MEFRKELLDKTNIAIRSREKGRLIDSRKKFQEILLKINPLKNSKSKNDQNTYIEIMGEWVIQLRHEGKQTFKNALDIASVLYKFSKTKKLNNPKAIRGISNTLMNLEGYEFAEKYLREMIELLPKESSAQIGDAKAHLARCMFRIGRMKEAEKTINEAIKDINLNSGKSTKLELAVWKSHSLVVKSLLLKSEGKLDESIRIVKEALRIARGQNVIPRIKEISMILNFLESKNHE